MTVEQMIAMAALPAIAAIVWAVRLEGRQHRHEAVCEERQRRLDERYAAMCETLEEIRSLVRALVEQRPPPPAPPRRH